MKEEKCLTSLDFKEDVNASKNSNMKTNNNNNNYNSEAEMYNYNHNHNHHKSNKSKDTANNFNSKEEFILPDYRNKSEEALKKIATEKWQIKINSLRYIIPELLFSPNMIGKQILILTNI